MIAKQGPPGRLLVTLGRLDSCRLTLCSPLDLSMNKEEMVDGISAESIQLSRQGYATETFILDPFIKQ